MGNFQNNDCRRSAAWYPARCGDRRERQARRHVWNLHVLGAMRTITVRLVQNTYCFDLILLRFHWWADVPAAKHEELHALPKKTIHGEPSIKYRGLFINDEAPALTGWWSKKHKVDHYPLDSEFYRHVFDLLLRLKANYLWPAMWASFVPKPGNVFFTDDTQNQQLADDYGIVVSTSHHEPMQRATNEWNETKTGAWDWTKNKANVTRFMEEGVRRAGKNESYFTLGMRGPNDGPIEAHDPIAVLEDVFDTERELLAKYHGNETAVNRKRNLPSYQQSSHIIQRCGQFTKKWQPTMPRDLFLLMISRSCSRMIIGEMFNVSQPVMKQKDPAVLV